MSSRVGIRRRLRRRMRLSVGGIMALAGLLAACSSGPSTDLPAMAHAVATQTVATQPATVRVRCLAQSLPSGWTWYQDARYPFRVAAPPGWRVGFFEYVPDGSDLGTASPSYIHVVDFFGPGSNGQARSTGKDRSDTIPPVITLEVGVGKSARTDASTAQNPVFHAQPYPICIGNTSVTLYLFSNSEGDVEQEATLPGGPDGYPYSFLVATSGTTAAAYSQLFLTMLSTFSPSKGP